MEHAHHLSQDRYWHGWKAAPDAISFEAPELLEMVTRLRESNGQRVPSTVKSISFGKVGEGIKLRKLGQLTRPRNLRN